jgi:hypothetical protein
MEVLKRVAPLAAILGAIIGLQVWWSQGYSPTGHAAEHLSSASVIFGMAFVMSAIVWGLPRPLRRRPVLWLLLAFVAIAAAFNFQGNMLVVDAIGDESWSLDTVDALGPTREGFDEGHARAELAGLAGVAAAGALCLWLGARRVTTPRLCAGSVVACVLFPYWIFPGFGLVIIAGVLVTRRVRRQPTILTVDPHQASTAVAT